MELSSESKPLIIFIFYFVLNLLVFNIGFYVIYPISIIISIIVALVVTLPFSIHTVRRTELVRRRSSFGFYKELEEKIGKYGFRKVSEDDDSILFVRKWWQSPFSNNVTVEKRGNGYQISGDSWLMSKLFQ
jgi:hypothetical protein